MIFSYIKDRRSLFSHMKDLRLPSHMKIFCFPKTHHADVSPTIKGADASAKNKRDE